MRKLFRMKYESCNGQCYAWSDVMKIHTLGLDIQGAAVFLRRLLAIHEPSCGNANLAFRLDADEEHGLFVASFQRYGALDLFGGKTPLEALNKMIDAALIWFSSDEYRQLVGSRPGLSYAACKHGEDRKLIDFAISFSGLEPAQQDALRALLAIGEHHV